MDWLSFGAGALVAYLIISIALDIIIIRLLRKNSEAPDEH